MEVPNPVHMGGQSPFSCSLTLKRAARLTEQLCSQPGLLILPPNPIMPGSAWQKTWSSLAWGQEACQRGDRLWNVIKPHDAFCIFYFPCVTSRWGRVTLFTSPYVFLSLSPSICLSVCLPLSWQEAAKRIQETRSRKNCRAECRESMWYRCSSTGCLAQESIAGAGEMAQ